MKRIGKFLLGLVISLTVIGAINIGTVEAKNTLNLGVMDKFNYNSQSKILRLDGWHAVNVGTFGSSQKYYHYIFHKNPFSPSICYPLIICHFHESLHISSIVFSAFQPNILYAFDGSA